MKLLGDVCHVESHFFLFGDSVTVCARYRRLRKSFWTHPTVPLGDEAQVEARFDPFGNSANLDAR